MDEFETILLERKGRVGTITMNRTNALNALNSAMLADVIVGLDSLENDPGIGAIVLTGSERAFAAGADIKEMRPRTFVDVFTTDFLAGWEQLAAVRKPIIAAVAGFALGGGCEVAMMCDMVIAADTARFGQPEITLGVIPGIGGSQRLTRAIAKAKSMDLLLTGRTMDADEAERAGLVSRVVPADQLLDEAQRMAETIASMSLPVAMLAKEAVNRSFESTLGEGLRFERRAFHSTFALDDQKEGMSAFIEKREPTFTHR